MVRSSFSSIGRFGLTPAFAVLALTPIVALLPLASLAAQPASTDDMPKSGTLMLAARGATDKVPALRLGTDLDVTISGSVARVRVTQAFRNTSGSWMEAAYVYPLPQDGAVDSLNMVVGQRVIIGHIRKRAEARAAYEKAKVGGQKAGLVEQQRPNIFTTNVANVGPGETVLISIEYQAPVAEANGTFSLRLPLVVGPRYVPPHTLTSSAAISDADAVTRAPVLSAPVGQMINPVTITVHLRPGFPLANVISRYHPILISGRDDDRTIRLTAGATPADRDFELDWRSASANPTVGLFQQRVAENDYVMLTITPPASVEDLPQPPREMVFVIDNSGSMGGASMDEAKASLVHALTTLRPQDQFNVIRFDDTLTRLFPRSVPATPAQVAIATRFAKGLEANGGTEMLPALKAALTDAAATGDAATLRQVIFLTDGEISNEQEMLATLAGDRGQSHVFFVGIGSAPNDHLMARMATLGRGTYTHVSTPDEVAAKMVPLLDILRHPAMQKLTVGLVGNKLDLRPHALPDLYPGQPLILLGRTDKLDGKLTISGRIGSQAWSQTLDLGGAIASNSIAKLWARRRIDDIEADRTVGKLEDAKADGQIEALGLEHGLVTSQTSLVAIDETRTRPGATRLSREDLPINLPAGWDFERLFGHDVASVTASGATEPTNRADDDLQQIDLPQTASGFAAMIGAGLLFLMIGVLGLTRLRRRTL